MSILDRLFKGKKETRSFVPVSTTPVLAPVLFSAEQNPTVSACVDKISKTLSSLPLLLYGNTGSGMRLAKEHSFFYALEDPSYEETPALFYRTWQRFLLLEGNAYLYKFKNSKGDVNGFGVIDSRKVRVERDATNRKHYHVDGKDYTDFDILHIPYPGPGYNGTVGRSPVETHKDLIELDNLLLSYVSNYFENSPGSRVVMNLGQTYAQKKANIEQVYAEFIPLMEKFVIGASNAGKPMIGLPDSTIGKIDQTSNVQAELKSLLNMVEHQIALSFGVPYETLDSEAAKYDSLESKTQDFLSSCIKPLGDHICQSFEKLLSPADRLRYSVRYEYKNLLTTNTAQTVDYLMKEFQGGALTMNEVRKKLGMEDMGPAGDYHFIPANLMPLTEENIDAYMAKSKVALEESNHNSNGDDKT